MVSFYLALFWSKYCLPTSEGRKLLYAAKSKQKKPLSKQRSDKIITWKIVSKPLIKIMQNSKTDLENKD